MIINIKEMFWIKIKYFLDFHRKAIGPTIPYYFDPKLTQDANVTSGLTPDHMAVNDLTYDQLVNK